MNTRFLVILALLSAAPFAACASLIAADRADNDPYPLGWNPGDNGGSGFTGWTVLESGTPGSMYTTAAIGTGTYSWGLSGTFALGRGLAGATNAGRWDFLASHDPDDSDFSGFNLKSSTNLADGFDTDELVRFGIDPSVTLFDDTGVYISIDGGNDYDFLDVGEFDLQGATLRYSMDWRDTGMFVLTVSNLSATGWGSYTGSFGGAFNVAMLGAAVYGVSSGESVTFDEFNVAAVPEPGVLGLCLFGFGFLLLRRVSRRG